MDSCTRRHLFFLLALTSLLFLTGLGARDLWAPVEPRYAEIVRVMFAKGEWIVPRVNGDVYTDKPILYFWMALVAAKWVGEVTEWTVRLPAAIGGIGFVLATYAAGRDFYSPRTGLLAATVLATSARVIWEARWAHIDLLFGMFFVLTVYIGARFLMNKSSRNEILLAYVFMGLATLSKGLIGVILPALLLLAWVIVTGQWRAVIQARFAPGIGLFLLVVVPWFYLVTSSTDGKWLADFIYIHHIQRYTEGYGHREPFYYYFTTLPLDCLPWTVFGGAAMHAYFPYRQLKRDRVALFFALWFAVVFTFFSASDTKRDLYLVPLLPVVALLVANYLDDLASGRIGDSAPYRALGQVFFAGLALAGLFLPPAAWIVRPEGFRMTLPAALLLVLGGAVTALSVRQRRPLLALSAVASLMTLTTLCTAVWILPYVDQFKSRRLFSLEIKRIVPANAPLYIYADSMHDFNYYTERERIPVLKSPSELAELLRQVSGGYILIKGADVKRLGLREAADIVASHAVGGTSWHLITALK